MIDLHKDVRSSNRHAIWFEVCVCVCVSFAYVMRQIIVEITYAQASVAARVKACVNALTHTDTGRDGQREYVEIVLQIILISYEDYEMNANII